MAPLCLQENNYDVFSNERFSRRLSLQLDEILPGVLPSRTRIRFCEAQNKVFNPEPEYYTDEDISAKWHRPCDLRAIRERAKVQSSALRKEVQASNCDIAVAHRKTTLIISADFKGLMKLSPCTPEDDLSRWCSVEDGRRGLERFSSSIYYCFRRRDMAEVREAVLNEQAYQRENHFYDPELIARRSREVSRRSRNFALFLGGADAKQIAKRKQSSAPCRQAPPRKRSKIFNVANLAAGSA